MELYWVGLSADAMVVLMVITRAEMKDLKSVEKMVAKMVE